MVSLALIWFSSCPQASNHSGPHCNREHLGHRSLERVASAWATAAHCDLLLFVVDAHHQVAGPAQCTRTTCALRPEAFWCASRLTTLTLRSGSWQVTCSMYPSCPGLETGDAHHLYLSSPRWTEFPSMTYARLPAHDSVALLSSPKPLPSAPVVGHQACSSWIMACFCRPPHPPVHC